MGKRRKLPSLTPLGCLFGDLFVLSFYFTKLGFEIFNTYCCLTESGGVRKLRTLINVKHRKAVVECYSYYLNIIFQSAITAKLSRFLSVFLTSIQRKTVSFAKWTPAICCQSSDNCEKFAQTSIIVQLKIPGKHIYMQKPWPPKQKLEDSPGLYT